jgi:hypothetical protein
LTTAEALDTIRNVGTVRAAEGKLKLVFPMRMRDSLAPALVILRANRMTALALVGQKTTPGDKEQHWQIWDEWKAAALNRLFELQGVLGEPGRITAATVRHGRLQEHLLEMERGECQEKEEHRCSVTSDEPHDKGYWGPNGIDLSRWGPSCGRGFVSNPRFGANRLVIPRTNRATTRKWRELDARAGE